LFVHFRKGGEGRLAGFKSANDAVEAGVGHTLFLSIK
jgi:hypothetical protein